MQLLRQSSSSLTKQTLPTKIPGCFALAPTTHQTWPDIREEVLQGTGRASLIPETGSTLLAVCLQESCQRLTYNIITAPLKWTQLGSKKLEAKKGKVLDYWTKNTKCRALTMISKFLKQTISVSSYVTTTFIGKLPLQTESISSTTDIMRSISKCHDMQRARRNVAMVFKPAYSSVDKGLPYQV